MDGQMQGIQRLRTAALTFTGLWLAGAGPAWAQSPKNWQLGFQPAQSNVQAGIEGLHSMVLWLMAAV